MIVPCRAFCWTRTRDRLAAQNNPLDCRYGEEKRLEARKNTKVGQCCVVGKEIGQGLTVVIRTQKMAKRICPHADSNDGPYHLEIADSLSAPYEWHALPTELKGLT